MAVASRICKMKQVLKNNSEFRAETEGKSWGDTQRFSASCKSGLTLLGITCLMGTTWGLAFLGSGFVNYPILYLFCILNSLQGLMSVCLTLFIWFDLYLYEGLNKFLCVSHQPHLNCSCVFLPRFLHLLVDLSLNQEAEEERDGGKTVFNSCEDIRTQIRVDVSFFPLLWVDL